MGLLASLFGCGKKQPSQPPPSVADMFVIDYARECGGAFHHGTFSLIGGKVGATWTIAEGGNKESREIPMTEETFRGIWDAFNDIPDFKAGVVKDPTQKLDPGTCHVVGIVFSVGGQKGTRTHAIPATSVSTAFKEWLAKLGYTGQ